MVQIFHSFFFLLAFKDKPPLPPTVAQKSILDDEKMQKPESYIESIKQLVTSVPSVLLIITYGAVNLISRDVGTGWAWVGQANLTF